MIHLRTQPAYALLFLLLAGQGMAQDPPITAGGEILDLQYPAVVQAGQTIIDSYPNLGSGSVFPSGHDLRIFPLTPKSRYGGYAGGAGAWLELVDVTSRVNFTTVAVKKASLDFPQAEIRTLRYKSLTGRWEPGYRPVPSIFAIRDQNNVIGNEIGAKFPAQVARFKVDRSARPRIDNLYTVLVFRIGKPDPILSNRPWWPFYDDDVSGLSPEQLFLKRRVDLEHSLVPWDEDANKVQFHSPTVVEVADWLVDQCLDFFAEGLVGLLPQVGAVSWISKVLGWVLFADDVSDFLQTASLMVAIKPLIYFIEYVGPPSPSTEQYVNSANWKVYGLKTPWTPFTP